MPVMSQRVSDAESDAQVLLRLVEATAHAIGAEFFATLVRHLCEVLGAPYAFVAEFADTPSRVRSLAYFGGREARSRTSSTTWPGRRARRSRAARSATTRAASRPSSRPTGGSREHRASRATWACRCSTRAGAILGHVALMDTAPMPEEPRRLAIFRIFAARAAAELERLRMRARAASSRSGASAISSRRRRSPTCTRTPTPASQSANRAFQQMLGLQPDEVTRTYGLSLVAPTRGDARARAGLARRREGGAGEAVHRDRAAPQGRRPPGVRAALVAARARREAHADDRHRHHRSACSPSASATGSRSRTPTCARRSRASTTSRRSSAARRACARRWPR